MNRSDLQRLAQQRLREAKALLKLRHFSGSYYLAGYSVECGLKACIAKQVRRYEFPDRERTKDSYTHDLRKLVKLANLEPQRIERASMDPAFSANWDLVAKWSEESRYEFWTQQDAEALIKAIMVRQHGVMPWLTRQW